MSVRTVAAAETSFLLREAGAGDGTPVLLLHGVPETSTCWQRLLPVLADGRRVLAPDLPGLGGSAYSGPYDVPALVAQLAALVEVETGGGPVDVVGHDWGGSLALALAGAHPQLVRRLAVANAPYRSVPMARAVHIPFFALPVAPELLFRLGGRRVVRLMLGLGWRSTTPLDPQAQAEYEAAYSRPRSVRAMLGYYRAATRPRIAAAVRRQRPAGRPRVRADKMLVLWGARDPVLPVSTGEGVVKDLGPECVMVTVPGAGHFVVEEAPDVVADVLRDFLGAAPTTGAAPPEGPPTPRVRAAEPTSGDLGDVPSVGPVPVGGTPAEPAQATPPAPAKAAKAAPAKAAKAAPAKAAKAAPAKVAKVAPAKAAKAAPAKAAKAAPAKVAKVAPAKVAKAAPARAARAKAAPAKAVSPQAAPAKVAPAKAGRPRRAPAPEDPPSSAS